MSATHRPFWYTLTLKFPRTATATYAQVEESLYNRLFIGRYKTVVYQAVSTTLPKVVVVVLYIGFQFGTFYSQEYSPRYQNTGPQG